MPSKRARPPGLSDGTEPTQQLDRPKTPSKAKSSSSRSDGKGTTPKSSKGLVKAAQHTKPKPKPVQNRIKVGVDFGTTNSGVAHVMSLNHDAQEVEVIKNWPDGLSNEQLEKVPSRYAFKADNHGLDEDKWGHEVPPGAQSITWFKLHLDANAEKTLFDSDDLTGKMGSGLSKLPANMTAEEVTVAYLSKLYSHTMDVLAKNYTTNILAATSIDVWFTVPATWQESAVAATRTAAEEAGFGSRERDTLNIITEPEAAAIAALSNAVEENPGLIKPGMNVLICDLGGGTLDFQVLTVTSITPRLETEETIPGMGGKSGSAYIDCNWHTFCETAYGDAFRKLPTQKTGAGSKFMKEWEVVKKTFNGKDLGKRSQVPLPALGAALRARDMAPASYDFEDHSVVVTGAEIAAMFEGSIQKAFDLIDELSEKLKSEELAPFKIMCLCGGLGSSEYVWRRFQQYKMEKLNGQCTIFTDRRAWSAVVRGAAIRGLTGSLVLSKKAKRAYGIGIHQAFRDRVDDEKDMVMCPVKGKRARGYVYWPVEVGQRFHENMRVKTDLYVTVPEDADEGDLVFRWKLFSCALEVLPDREDHGNVKTEGSITLDLCKTYKRSKRNDGGHDGHEAVKIGIVFKMGNQQGTLMVEALHGKKVVGVATIDYAKSHTYTVKSQSAGLLDG